MASDEPTGSVTTPQDPFLLHHQEHFHLSKRLSSQIHQEQEFKRPMFHGMRVIPSGYLCNNNKLERRLKTSEDYITATQKQFGTVCIWGKKREKTQRVEIWYKYFVTTALAAASSPTTPWSSF